LNPRAPFAAANSTRGYDVVAKEQIAIVVFYVELAIG